MPSDSEETATEEQEEEDEEDGVDGRAGGGELLSAPMQPVSALPSLPAPPSASAAGWGPKARSLFTTICADLSNVPGCQSSHWVIFLKYAKQQEAWRLAVEKRGSGLGTYFVRPGKEKEFRNLVEAWVAGADDEEEEEEEKGVRVACHDPLLPATSGGLFR